MYILALALYRDMVYNFIDFYLYFDVVWFDNLYIIYIHILFIYLPTFTYYVYIVFCTVLVSTVMFICAEQILVENISFKFGTDCIYRKNKWKSALDSVFSSVFEVELSVWHVCSRLDWINFRPVWR